MSKVHGKRKDGREDSRGGASKLSSSSTGNNKTEFERTGHAKSVQQFESSTQLNPTQPTQIHIFENANRPMQEKPKTPLITEISPQISEINQLLRKPYRSPKEHWQLLRTTRKLLKDASIDEMFNDNRPFVEISIKGENIRGLLDSGASISCL